MPLDPNIAIALIAATPPTLALVPTFLAGRRSGKNSFITAVHEAAHQVITTLREEIQRMEAAREQCEEGHRKCEADLASVRREIAALMSGPVAPYGRKR